MINIERLGDIIQHTTNLRQSFFKERNIELFCLVIENICYQEKVRYPHFFSIAFIVYCQKNTLFEISTGCLVEHEPSEVQERIDKLLDVLIKAIDDAKPPIEKCCNLEDYSGDLCRIFLCGSGHDDFRDYKETVEQLAEIPYVRRYSRLSFTLD